MPSPTPRRLLIGAATVAVSLVLTVGVAASQAANPVTPGTFTGYGFDQCNAPSQKAMTAWRSKSPFRAVGIYISGNSRACLAQPNLTPTWVSTQIAAGWHLLPITLGPQTSCNPRFPRYSANTDPTISPAPAYTYAAARLQAQAVANTAVATAKQLGIRAGSTLFYDLEGWSTSISTDCNNSALRFLSAWSNRLHALGYLSGVYSSAGSGMVLLDRARVNQPTGWVAPDQIWLADWDGKANTTSSYFSNTGWAGGQRVKQYQGGHNETWGGVKINIDRDYMVLRSRAVPRAIAELPTGPTTPPPPQNTSKCTRQSISRPAYLPTSIVKNTPLVLPLQCLLAQQHYYTADVTGTWNSATRIALEAWQAKLHRRVHPYATRSDWVALITAGASNSTLRLGSTGSDVIMLQRALNAARSDRLQVSGTFDAATKRSVSAYQKTVLRTSTGVVAAQTWAALHAGKW